MSANLGERIFYWLSDANKLEITGKKNQTKNQNKHTSEFEILWRNYDWFLTPNVFK